ncbi:hypothetical protein DXG03_007894, partial [Asterophora parasitica]
MSASLHFWKRHHAIIVFTEIDTRDVLYDVSFIHQSGDALLAKIRKVAESIGATLYPIDANADKRSDSLREVSLRLDDLQTILYNTGANGRTELLRLGEHLRSWQDVIRKENLIYETLNLFNYDMGKTIIAEGWVPTRDITNIQLALRHATVRGIWHQHFAYSATNAALPSTPRAFDYFSSKPTHARTQSYPTQRPKSFPAATPPAFWRHHRGYAGAPAMAMEDAGVRRTPSVGKRELEVEVEDGSDVDVSVDVVDVDVNAEEAEAEEVDE